MQSLLCAMLVTTLVMASQNVVAGRLGPPPPMPAGATENKAVYDAWVQSREPWTRPVHLNGSSIIMEAMEYEKYEERGELPPILRIDGEITEADIPVLKSILAPYLDPKYLKTHPNPSRYTPNPALIGYTMLLNSPGGDVVVAMELGRMMRKARVAVLTQKCLSSCVLLLAGAVRRAPGPNQVGIHRPFLSDTRERSFEEMQSITSRLGDLVAAYLKEMNIPSSLYDAMVRVPPEHIQMLDYDQLETYGLSADDPVFAELQRNAEARVAGLPKTEYLARAAAYEECVKKLTLSSIRAGKSTVDRLFDEGYNNAKDRCFNSTIGTK